MHTPPFRAFVAPDPDTISSPEAVASGLGLGALLGSAVPALALGGEVLAGGSLQAVLATPSPSLLMAFAVPAFAAAVGAWGTRLLHAHRAAYDTVATKAASLMDEAFDLRARLDHRGVVDHSETFDLAEPRQSPDLRVAPPLPAEDADLGPDTFRPPRSRRADDAALITAQAQLLSSFGEATQDTARRMHVNLRGLALTDLSLVQQRLVDALEGHVEGLWDLADDVVGYVDEDPSLVPAQDPRSAKPRRPPGRVAA